MWPVHFRQNNGIGSDSPEKFSADLPFYSSFRSSQRNTTSVLWPFFNWIDDRDRKYHEREMPWPFVMVAHGQGKTGLRIFPFYSHVYNDTFKDNFYLWPIYKYNSIYAPPLDRRRSRILFFLFQDTVEKNTDTGKVDQRIDLWPLFVYHHGLDGGSRLQIIAPLETFVPDSPGIEVNWSPLWSIWRQENNSVTGARSQSFLWNFCRHDASPDAKKTSFFFGLYQDESTRDTKIVRVFYIPVVDRHPYRMSSRQ
jgi:hypothetical protein